jgi:hypothetical protein
MEDELPHFLRTCSSKGSAESDFQLISRTVGITLNRKNGFPQTMSAYSYNSDIGQTDLMGAAFNGNADEVARILTMPCDIDAQDSHGITASCTRQ